MKRTEIRAKDKIPNYSERKADMRDESPCAQTSVG
jgi:hypothetical protein